MTIKRVDHVGVMVADMERSIAFYTGILGLTLKSQIKHTNGVIDLAFLGTGAEGETDLELIRGYNDRLPEEGKVHHVAFAVDDVERWFRDLSSQPVEFVDKEITTLPNGYKYFFIMGPDRERIELFQR